LKHLVLFFGLFTLFTLSVCAQKKRYAFTADKMGSPINMVFVAPDAATANSLSNHCFALIDSLIHVFSDYDSTSEISNINTHAGISPSKVSALMLDMLHISTEAYHKSNGAYNIAIGPLSVLWRTARTTKVFPTKAIVDSAKELTDFLSIIINEKDSTIFLPHKGMRLDVGGLGKGYVAQKVLNYLMLNGITEAMIDAGGKIVTCMPAEENNDWIIGVNISRKREKILNKRLHIKNLAVATSGDVYQFFNYKGIRYSHIINPVTGYGLTTMKNVTVIASSGVLADWLATACSVLAVKQAIQLVESLNAEMLLAVKKRNKIVYYKTSGLNNYFY
jgi:thiamine biosynthesis lipoprotein